MSGRLIVDGDADLEFGTTEDAPALWVFENGWKADDCGPKDPIWWTVPLKARR